MFMLVDESQNHFIKFQIINLGKNQHYYNAQYSCKEQHMSLRVFLFFSYHCA